MSKLAEIKPKEKPNLIDLVRAAGVDVSDWANCNTAAARNPKYCYEWSFEGKKVVVFNLWHDHMKPRRDGNIFIEMNPKKLATQLTGIESVRASKTDKAIRKAINENLPIRVIILEGKRREITNLSAKASRVFKRQLDPVPWSVTSYDQESGHCELSRGLHPLIGATAVTSESAIDDLSDVPEGSQFPDRAKVISHLVKRNNRVRAYALRRAKGKCEYCNVQGFPTPNGKFYIEAHHIIALCDSGYDTVDNVIALCPQHHRQAHYGVDAESLEAKFITILKRINAS